MLLCAVALAYALALTVYRGFQVMGSWPQATWLISYDFGFIRRGINGEFMQLFLDSADPTAHAESVMQNVSIGIFAVFMIVLLYACMRTITALNNSPAAIALCLAFLCSPFTVVSGFMFAHFDAIFISFTALAIVLLRHHLIWAAALVLVFSMFVHEITLLVGVPTVFVVTSFLYARQGNRGQAFFLEAGFLKRYAVIGLLPVAAFTAITLHQSALFDAEQVYADLNRHIGQFDFIDPVRGEEVVLNTTMDFSGHASEQIQAAIWRLTRPEGFVHTGLTMLPFYLLGILVMLRARAPWLLQLGFLVAPLVPLSLHFVAFDIERNWTFSIVMVFLMTWGLLEVQSRDTTLKLSKQVECTLFLLALCVFVSNVFISTSILGTPERLTSPARIVLYAPVIALLIGYAGWYFTEDKHNDAVSAHRSA